MGFSEDAGEVGLETAQNLLLQIRSAFQRFDGGGALASVDARRDAAISDIGLAHDIAANKIAELRGLLNANSQLDVFNSECAAVLLSRGVFCIHCTENHNTIHDERAKRTLFIAPNSGYPQNSRLYAQSKPRCAINQSRGSRAIKSALRAIKAALRA
jgi:hypothetical protein